MKRLAVLALLISGCATRHPMLIAVPVGAACIAGLGAAAAMSQSHGAGDPIALCAGLAEAIAASARPPKLLPEPAPCVPMGNALPVTGSE